MHSLGPLQNKTTERNQFKIVIADRYWKRTRVITGEKMTAVQTATISLVHWAQLCRSRSQLWNDHGTQFKGKFFTTLFFLLRIKSWQRPFVISGKWAASAIQLDNHDDTQTLFVWSPVGQGVLYAAPAVCVKYRDAPCYRTFYFCSNATSRFSLCLEIQPLCPTFSRHSC